MHRLSTPQTTGSPLVPRLVPFGVSRSTGSRFPPLREPEPVRPGPATDSPRHDNSQQRHPLEGPHDDLRPDRRPQQHLGHQATQPPLRGTTKAAAPNVAYLMLTDASNRLAAYAAAALKAGVEERRVRLAEKQGALVADVIRGILADLHLTPEQELLVGTVVPQRLRQLAAAPEGA